MISQFTEIRAVLLDKLKLKNTPKITPTYCGDGRGVIEASSGTTTLVVIDAQGLQPTVSVFNRDAVPFNTVSELTVILETEIAIVNVMGTLPKEWRA